jgi:hypothetical protein
MSRIAADLGDELSDLFAAFDEWASEVDQHGYEPIVSPENPDRKQEKTSK